MRTKIILVSAVCGVALISGCSKKEAQAPVEAIAPAAPQTAQPAKPAAHAAPQGSLADAQAALSAKNYDLAADIIIQLQAPRQGVTPEQAAAAASQMRALQQNLMGAVSSGDPRAIAAAQRLRAASTPR